MSSEREHIASEGRTPAEMDEIYANLKPIYFVDLYWIEKLWLIFDYLQIHAIYWVTANAWSWPYYFIEFTHWSVYANFDFFSITKDGALLGQTNRLDIATYGSMEGYISTYAVYFALVTPVLIATYIVINAFLTRYGRKQAHLVPYLQMTVLALALITYVPCTLSLFRLFSCDDAGMVSADPSVTCNGLFHLSAFIAFTLMTLPLIVLLPICVHELTKDAVIYKRSAADHEKRIQAWEIGYTLGIDMNYHESHIWLLSSFTLQGVFLRRDMLILKAVLLILYIGARWHKGYQAFLMMMCLLLFHVCILYETGFEGPYRKPSTNRIFLGFAVASTVNAIFGVMNAFGVENAVMVASTQSLVMFAINGVCILFMFVVIICAVLPRSHWFATLCYCGARFDDDTYALWPSMATLRRIRRSRKRAPHMAPIVLELQDAYAVLREARVAPPATADVLSLEEMIRRLQHKWLYCRQKGSIFQIIISDCLEEMLLLQAYLEPVAARYKLDWDDEWSKSRRRLNNRYDRYALMTSRKRRILMKLVALSAFKHKTTKGDLDTIPSAVKAEVESLKNRVVEETIKSEKLLDDSDPNHPLFLLGSDVQDILERVKESLDFWQQVVELSERGNLPGWGKYADDNQETWYFLRGNLTTRVEELHELVEEKEVALAAAARQPDEGHTSDSSGDDDDDVVARMEEGDALLSRKSSGHASRTKLLVIQEGTASDEKDAPMSVSDVVPFPSRLPSSHKDIAEAKGPNGVVSGDRDKEGEHATFSLLLEKPTAKKPDSTQPSGTGAPPDAEEDAPVHDVVVAATVKHTTTAVAASKDGDGRRPRVRRGTKKTSPGSDSDSSSTPTSRGGGGAAQGQRGGRGRGRGRGGGRRGGRGGGRREGGRGKTTD